MKKTGLNLEDLLPHRGRMMLLHEIVEMDENRAVTASIVSKDWPFFQEDAVGSIVMIELIAQTSGISNGLERIRTHGIHSEKKGWLVGIKKATFHRNTIPIGTKIITCTEKRFEFDGFREMIGTAHIGTDLVCEASLQVFQAEAAG